MPKHIAKGDKIIEDNGWCEFIATDKYRDNISDIFGNRCTRCRVNKADKGKIYCQICEKETENE